MVKRLGGRWLGITIFIYFLFFSFLLDYHSGAISHGSRVPKPTFTHPAHGIRNFFWVPMGFPWA